MGVADEEIKVRLDEEGWLRASIGGSTYLAKMVDAHVEAREDGGVFPPLEVQRVRVEDGGKPEEKLTHLEGRRRVRAYRDYEKQVEAGVAEAEARFRREDVLAMRERLDELRPLSGLCLRPRRAGWIRGVV